MKLLPAINPEWIWSYAISKSTRFEHTADALDTIFRDVGGADFLGRVAKGRVRFSGGPLDGQQLAVDFFRREFRHVFEEEHLLLVDANGAPLIVQYAAVYWPSFFAPSTYVLAKVVPA